MPRKNKKILSVHENTHGSNIESRKFKMWASIILIVIGVMGIWALQLKREFSRQRDGGGASQIFSEVNNIWSEIEALGRKAPSLDEVMEAVEARALQEEAINNLSEELKDQNLQ